MKTFRKASFFLLAAVLAGSVVSPCCAQTAEEIVNKNIDAIGGKALLSSIKTVVIDASAEVMGNEMPSTTYILNGKGFKSETDFNGTKIVQCFTDHGGWMIFPPSGQTTATAIPDELAKQAKGRLYIGGPLMEYSTNGGKVELIGKDTADYKVHLTDSDGTDATFYINMKTFMIDMVTAKVKGQDGSDVETTMHFSDYRKTDGGPMMAFTQSTELPQYTVNVTFKKVEVNKPLDPAIFDMPK